MTDLATRHEALTKAQARTLTQEVKDDAERLWFKLLQLYEGGAHLTLGYSSWGDYFEAEFGGDRSRGYRILSAARVVDSIAQSPIGDSVPTESQARELTALKEPADVRAAWTETNARAAAEHRPVTAQLVREVVTDFKPGIKTELKKAGLSRRPSITDAASRVVREAVQRGGVYHVPSEAMRELMLALGKG